jgi:hypothetical protein
VPRRDDNGSQPLLSLRNVPLVDVRTVGDLNARQVCCAATWSSTLLPLQRSTALRGRAAESERLGWKPCGRRAMRREKRSKGEEEPR